MLSCEVGWFHGAAFCEWMAGFAQQKDALRVKALRLVRGIDWVIAHVDDEIEFAGFEFGGEGCLDVGAETDLDVREFATEVAEDDRQAVGEDALRGADAEGTAWLVTDRSLALFHRGEGLLGERLKSPASVGQNDATPKAIKEGNTEFFLERLDLRSDVGLNGVNTLGSPGEVQFFGESPKYLKLTNFHRYLRNRWKSSYQSIGQMCELDSHSEHEKRLAKHEKIATLARLLNLTSSP
jgi:hypothetical protein